MDLIPDQWIAADGLGPALAVRPGASCLLKLTILESAAQQSLDVQLETTADGLDWQVLAAFPTQTGPTQAGPTQTDAVHATLPLDLPADALYLRAHWRAKTWAQQPPRFRVTLTAQIKG